MNTMIPLWSDYILHKIVDTGEQVFFGYDVKENKILYLSAAFEAMWNRSIDSIGADISIIAATVHPDDKVLMHNTLQTLTETGKKYVLEFRILISEQQQKWIKVSAWLTDTDSYEIVIGTVTDITTEKENHEQIFTRVDKKNAVLDILSHDLSAPFAAIQMAANTLKDYGANKDDELLIEILEIIIERSKSGLNLIHNFLDSELKEFKENNIVKERTDLIARINEIISQYQDSQFISKSRIRMISNLPNLYLSLDVTKFMQAILNLISNALKFTHDDGGSILINVEELHDHILITIQDNGIGIPQAMMPHLFDKFTIAKRPGIKGEQTRGLGMFAIKNIIEWHNGTIRCISEESKGTTFIIQMPKE